MPDKAIKSYIRGQWTFGRGSGTPLYSPVDGSYIGHVSTEGIDLASVLQYGREVGGPALRKMSFYERGLMLKKLALYLYERRKKYYPISYLTGATKGDSWLDIDGGIGVLFSYASLRRKLGSKTYIVEGEPVSLSREGGFSGQHVLVPREGVAVHINAFNFPIWGMLEKAAVNWLAGMPAVVKPATVSCYLTQAIVEDIIASGILPEGALQLLCGPAHDIVDHVIHQDVVTFTGSATTGKKLKCHPRIIEESVPFNMEADSLNAAVLAPDAAPDTPEFELFIKEVTRELTVKCGQKCTAIRRVLVPAGMEKAVIDAIHEALNSIVIGDPRVEGVQMGALVSHGQLMEVRERLEQLRQTAEVVVGDPDHVQAIGQNTDKGAYIAPIVLYEPDPWKDEAVHQIEAFGPVTTVMPYRDLDEAIALSKRGKGSLVTTIATMDARYARDFTLGVAAYHGRILILNRESAPHSTGHGSPLPMLVHGGPGRAGGGEEMGGLIGMKLYLQRTALQGHPTMLTEIVDVYIPGAAYKDPGIHPFRKYFEDLQVGETLHTHKRTITEADIVNFANVSWDHFYAHTDITSLEGTPFEQRVAHGYFILSAAAGLFVDPAKGPVLLNYGIEECRFIKPVYAGMTIGVRLTVKDKIDQEQKSPDDIPKGIVKFYVDVYDETGDSVAIATILTMIKKREG